MRKFNIISSGIESEPKMVKFNIIPENIKSETQDGVFEEILNGNVEDPFDRTRSYAFVLNTDMRQDIDCQRWITACTDCNKEPVLAEILAAPSRWFDKGNIKYITWQLERGLKTRQYHLQGFVYFTNQRVKSSLEKIDKRVGWLKNNWNIEKAIAYPNKSATRIMGPWELGTKPDQGKRTDIDTVVKMMKEGTSFIDIVDMPGMGYLSFSRRPFTALEQDFMDKKYSGEHRDVKCSLYYGNDRSAIEELVYSKYGKDFFSVDFKDGNFIFDGYRNQRVIVLDGFRGHVDVDYFGRLSSSLYSKHNTKGSTVWGVFTEVVVISSTHFKYWYSPDPRGGPTASSKLARIFGDRVYLHDIKSDDTKLVNPVSAPAQIDGANTDDIPFLYPATTTVADVTPAPSNVSNDDVDDVKSVPINASNGDIADFKRKNRVKKARKATDSQIKKSKDFDDEMKIIGSDKYKYDFLLDSWTSAGGDASYFKFTNEEMDNFMKDSSLFDMWKREGFEVSQFVDLVGGGCGLDPCVGEELESEISTVEDSFKYVWQPNYWRPAFDRLRRGSG